MTSDNKILAETWSKFVLFTFRFSKMSQKNLKVGKWPPAQLGAGEYVVLEDSELED